MDDQFGTHRLPAAVEVAAFRIVAEALTNMARHAQAHSCRVAVSRNGVLRIEIIDDGIGLPPLAGPGVGLHSMQERAAELGGHCAIGPASGRGTAIRVELPLGPAQHTTTSVDGRTAAASPLHEMTGRDHT